MRRWLSTFNSRCVTIAPVEPLTETEARVLGTLIEKQYATPDYYPMTLNAVRLGANQKNNRNPVTNYTDQEVQQALDSLQYRKLSGMFHEHGARSPKYRQFLEREFKLEPPATALMAVLLLRGPQTLGELKARSESMYKFTSLVEVEEALGVLCNLAPQALAVRLERQAGEREARYAHLLCGAPIILARPEEKSELEQRIETLEAEVRVLQQELRELKRSLGA